ncbi:MAG: alpha/beta hydrolase fold domain-containing protein [Planctomycetes bacterium]|nr:alpha/beta hydrolase fold domain-containing protein [Planctomycetota bacterium]
MRFLVLFLLAVASLAQQQPSPASLIGQPLGELAALRWVTADGKPPAPGPTLWRWWTVDCPFCRDSLPDLAALAKAHAAQGLRLVAVFHDKSGRPPADARLQAYLAGLGVDAVLARDDDWRELRPLLQRGASAQATSISVLTDAAGIVRYVHPGPRLHERRAVAHPEAAAAFVELRTAIAGMLGTVTELAIDAAVPQRRVQVWQPPGGPAQGPVVVWIAGSGWRQAGQDPQPIAAALQAAGIRCVVAHHRLGAAGSWRLAMQDLAHAVTAVRAGLHGQFAADSPIVLAGHGSGAWAALLLASDPQWLEAVAVRKADIAGVLALSPPTDLRAAESGRGRRLGDLLLREGDATVFGGESEMAASSPVTHGVLLPPVFCVVGAGDLPMLLADANAFAGRAREAGTRVEVARAPGRRHAQVPMILGEESALGADVLTFLRDPGGLGR